MGEGTTYFKMEVEYYYYKYVHNLLVKMYGEVRVTLEDTFLEVKTSDGYFKGIELRIEPGIYEVSKVGRGYKDDKIYQWFGGALKGVQGQRHCDTVEEYRLLMVKVVNPLQNLVEGMEKEGVTLQYIGEQEVQRVTGVRLGEHERLLRVVKKFGESIETILGESVTVIECGYFSRQHYLKMGSITLLVGGGKRIIQYNLPMKHVGVYDSEGEEVSKGDILGQIARVVYKERSFTEFDKKRLRDSLEVEGER